MRDILLLPLKGQHAERALMHPIEHICINRIFHGFQANRIRALRA